VCDVRDSNEKDGARISYINSIKMVPFDHVDEHDEHGEGEHTRHHLP